MSDLPPQRRSRSLVRLEAEIVQAELACTRWRKDVGRGALLSRGRRYKPSGRRLVCCLVWSLVEAALLHGRRSCTKPSLVRLHGTHPDLAAVFTASGSRGQAASRPLFGQRK